MLAGGRQPRRVIPDVTIEAGLVVEDGDGRFCGAVAQWSPRSVVLEDRSGRRREFPLTKAGFLLDGKPVTLVAPAASTPRTPRARTASGSFALADARARTARASRIWVEGVHDAALLERIWGADLRVEGVVVEPMDGVDDLPALVTQFAPTVTRRVGVLVDHLVPGSKESRIAASVHSPHVLINGHPYVDIWQAVKPSALGISGWPTVPRTVQWKDGVAAALGFSEPRELWRRVLGSVDSFADVEVPLLRAVEELIDFVTAAPEPV